MNPIQCNEVVMRDGFHIEPDFAPTAAKAVMGRIRRVPGVEYTVLVPDVRGMGLANVLAAARRLPQIVGHDVPSQVAKTGRITNLHAAPPDVAELRKAFT